jgi:ABC-2 type transport system ATP-binding protein
VIKDLRKVYPGMGDGPPKIANKNISFKVSKGELFGLLGPNGAGKTTLIQQLTGIYPASSGNAWMCGHGLNSDLDIIRLQIGMCPQFDILWEHFYRGDIL